MGEWIAIQSKHRLVCLSLQLESLGVNVTCLEIDLSVVELEHRNVAIAINWNIVWMRWHEWIHHYSVEATVDLLGNLSEDDLQRLSAFVRQWIER